MMSRARARLTALGLTVTTVLTVAACVPPPPTAAPGTTTTSTTTTSTTTTEPTVDPNAWVGQCYPVAKGTGIESLLVATVVLDDGDHWVAEFGAHLSSDCSGSAMGTGYMAFGADADEGAAACIASLGMMWSDGGTMADWWVAPMPPQARLCLLA